MSGTPNLNILFIEEGQGAAVCHTIEDGGEVKHMIHSHLEKPYTISRLKLAKKVSDQIDVLFKSKGVDKLYTWGISEEQHRYNTFMGYTLTGNEITINGQRGNPAIFEYVKEL